MRQPYPHPMMPQANHDELARQNIVAQVKMFMEDEVYPADRMVFESVVRPELKRTGKEPGTKHDVRAAMRKNEHYQTWSSICRTLQEMNWYNTGEIVERQLPALIQNAKDLSREPIGSVQLDPTLDVPRYNSEIDIHCMPGGYHTEIAADDVFAGALYDRGAHYYGVPIMGKVGHGVVDRPGRMFKERTARLAIEAIKTCFPDLNPRRILDMGCTGGGSTLAYKEAFPDAEVHGIDIAAPQVRYAHARAEGLGKCVHFSQQNAESTSLPDGHFDLVTSHGLAHETSSKAIRRILKECHRLLRRGGVTMHFDPQFSRGLDPYDSAMHDWDAYNNNEPFWGTLHETPAIGLLTQAGFRECDVVDLWGTFDAEMNVSVMPANDRDSSLSRASLFGARKY